LLNGIDVIVSDNYTKKEKLVKTKVESRIVVDLMIFKFFIIKRVVAINTVNLARILGERFRFSVNGALM
jgi:hypothetical protein